MSALSEVEKAAFHAIRKRLTRCPAWCFCNTKKWQKVKYVKHLSGELREPRERNHAEQMKHQEVRRFSLMPMCPLIAFLCPPGGLPMQGEKVNPAASLYMTTIEGTRFNDVIFECEVEYGTGK
jgi:hypothetical protein